MPGKLTKVQISDLELQYVARLNVPNPDAYTDRSQPRSKRVKQKIDCQLDEIVGLKYAVDNIYAFKKIAEQVGDKAAMTCGLAEDPCIDYMENGAIGFSSGMVNFVPRMSMSLLQNFMSGNKDEAERLRNLMILFEDFRGENGAQYSSSALHSAMDYIGLSGGPVIPLSPFSPCAPGTPLSP